LTSVAERATATFMIKGFRSKGLRELSEKGRSAKIGANFQSRAKRILDMLKAATKPSDCNVPGFDFHELEGDRKDTFALSVSANFRVTFQWNDSATNVDLEDYHRK
jgi:proteic killer suppression protein